MCTKQQLKNFLEEISDGAKFQLFNYVSAEQFTVLIKCRVENDRSVKYYSEFAKEWIGKFSKFTKTAWIVRKCFPNLKRLVYRKVYVCQLSSHNKKKITCVRNKECGAKIDFKMKFINRNTIKNDRSLRDGLNLSIHIDFVHTHGIRVRESLDLLKCSSDTDEIFYKYFCEGHTAPTAKSYHDLNLLSKYGTSNYEYLTNSEISPSLSHVTYLQRKNKGNINHDVAKTMSEKKNSLEERGGALRYTDDYSITVVITPFMKNVLSGHDLDDIIIDSTPMKDIVVSFFLVPSPLGALPIACALHSQNTEPSYSQAFFSTKLLLENQTMKSFEPKKIMINVIDEQNHALDAIFSNKSLFVSRASMVEEIWRIICDNDNRIEGKHRHNIMVLFHSLLNAENSEEADKYYKQLSNDKLVEAAPKLKEYLNDIRHKRDDYITQNENKVIDISVRILKQFLLSKCNTYNSLIMIDVLMNILDGHWCQILHANLNRSLVMETYTKFLSRDKSIVNATDMKTSEHEYRLDRETKLRRVITFRSDTMCCDCIKGRKGRLCDHLCAILNTTELAPSVPKDKRAFYTALAGEEIRDEVLNIKSEVDNEDETNEMAEETIEMDQSTSNECNEYYYCIVKEEMQEPDDPLQGVEKVDQIDDNVCKMKRTYENALKALNDEFRRLNRLFRDNPNGSNLDAMGRLARELGKIKPVEHLNLSSLCLEINNGDTDSK